LPVGAGPNYIVYEASQNRAYVTSPASKSLSIIENATGAAPTVITLPLTGTACSGVPISVTALADGTRVYVADKATNTVCVLNTTNNQFVRSIPVGTAPVFIASDSDSMRVYTANSGSQDVSIIETSTDTKVPVTICAGPPMADAQGHVTCPASFIPNYIAMTP
jgi:YVTN family beta-propeller protein